MFAEGDVVLLSLSRIDLLNILGESFDMVLYKNSARIALDKSETYGPMQNYHENLIDCMYITSYNSEETVIPS